METPVSISERRHGFESLDHIVANGYCIGCGLCEAVAPTAHIEMVLAANGHRRPRPRRPIPAGEERAILQTCPGINIEGPFEHAHSADPVWGEARRVATGWATDPELRHRASSGGVMTAINAHLLMSGRASFVLQVTADPDDPFHSIPVMVRQPENLLLGAQSRYSTCSPLTSIREALSFGELFAVSLKPCDVAAVRNLQRVDAAARELIVFTQTMFCGSVPSIHDSVSMLTRRGITADADPALVGFQWRGNGCPGPTTATFDDSSQATGTYNELWNDNPWSTQFRCKICPDTIGLQADLATGDCWEGGVPTGETDGVNAIIAHTTNGIDVLAECEAAGLLTLTNADVSLLDRTQPHHTRLRQTFMTRVAAATLGGLPEPNFASLAASRTAAQLPPDQHADTFAGTLARVRSGQADGQANPDYGTTTNT